MLLAAAVACAAGCGRAPPSPASPLPAARAASAAGFTAQCERLPASVPAVVAAPLTIDEDESLPLAELAQRSPNASASHRTLGLTVARVGHQVRLELEGLSDPSAGRACFRPRMSVELYLRPLTVYVAREIAADPCRRDAVHAHEMQHVAVYESYLREARDELARALPEALGDRIYYADDAAGAQRAAYEDLTRVLAERLERDRETLAARQRAVDSPEEYARIAAACGGAAFPAASR